MSTADPADPLDAGAPKFVPGESWVADEENQLPQDSDMTIVKDVDLDKPALADADFDNNPNDVHLDNQVTDADLTNQLPSTDLNNQLPATDLDNHLPDVDLDNPLIDPVGTEQTFNFWPFPADNLWNFHPNFGVPGFHAVPHTVPFMIGPQIQYPMYFRYTHYPLVPVAPIPIKLSIAEHRQRKIDHAWQARRMFDICFGNDQYNLRAWQDICYICGRDAKTMPRTIKGCRKWLGRVYVNIFDFIEAARAYEVVEPRFDCARDLDCYTKQTGQMCPAFVARGNPILGFMLRRFRGKNGDHKN